MSNIHPTAIVEEGAELGVDVQVGPFAVIYPQTQVGDRCTVGSHSVILPRVTLGEECRLHAHVVIGDLPQDLTFMNGESTLIIGDRCVMHEFFTAHRGTKEESETQIGSDCYFMNFSHVGHNCRVEDRVILANSSLLAGYVDVEDGAFLSGNTSVHQFTRLGRLSMMGGNPPSRRMFRPFAQRNRLLPTLFSPQFCGNAPMRNGAGGANAGEIRVSIAVSLRTHAVAGRGEDPGGIRFRAGA